MGCCSFSCRVADPAVFPATNEAAEGKANLETQKRKRAGDFQHAANDLQPQAIPEEKEMSIPLNQTPEEKELDEMAMMIRKLAQALRKAAPEHDLPQKALDYLKRKGLQGRVFRG